MKTIDINSITPPGGEVATFQDARHEANVSFFGKKQVFMINLHPVPEMVTEWA